jgi:hypothetical protein
MSMLSISIFVGRCPCNEGSLFFYPPVLKALEVRYKPLKSSSVSVEGESAG